jgi:outer membrane protein assembly factor BamB
MIRSLFALAATAALSFVTPLQADDWPEFRGPTGQGLLLSGSLPTEWGPAKNVAWKQEIPGKGWSSPVVVNGRIYLTTAVPIKDSATKDLALEALCLDAKTGQTVWETKVFQQDGAKSPAIQGKNSHASPTPLVSGDRLYVHFGHQGTACLDLEGNVVWRNDTIKYAPVHGNGGTPIVVDDLLIFSCDGGDKRFVVALDRGTGQVRWQTDRDVNVVKKFSFSTPLLITVNGQKQVISPGSNVVSALDPATGKEIWRVRYNGYSVIPRPVYGHGLLFIVTGYDASTVMAIRPDGQGDVTDTHVAWTIRKNAPHTPSLLLLGEELYMVSDGGMASCVDAKTGKVHWQQPLERHYSASPLAADGKIYFQSEEGVGTVIKAGKQFEQVARNDLGEHALASFAAADGALFIRTEKGLYRIEAK